MDVVYCSEECHDLARQGLGVCALETCRQVFVRPDGPGRPAKYHHPDCGREAARLASARRIVADAEMRQEVVDLRAEVARLRARLEATALPERLIRRLVSFMNAQGVEWTDMTSPVATAVEEVLDEVTHLKALLARERSATPERVPVS